MTASNEVEHAAARDTITRFYRAIEHADISLLRTAVTSDWQYLPGASGQPVGVEQMAPMLADLLHALPDMKITLLDALIHDTMVGVRAKVTGTQSGPLMGIPATSKPVDFAIHSFHELRDDCIAKTWHLEDWLGLFRQIGELPPGLANRPS
ncbi:ester cyclase [Caballeronia mineralivorans PML1(12)]|uniref:Ester cyclase n=1 Tax=Caballeronia mineralivorans PML1(12) TaxID=908627 RepID=A0A0J1CUA9_9BURK|nr:ester cyclase [Caballeronia mineralivorans]KLU24187.1 ester cyclase [Caballeronia mineralivorans PML1(12)]